MQTKLKYGSCELAATLHYPANREEGGPRFPVVVICHGFVGNRIGADRMFVKAARELALRGMAVLRFDYAGCGESEGEYGATGMESWVEQTRYAIDFMLELDGADSTRVALIGHSLGGAAALLTAAVDKRVDTLALWAPAGHPLGDIVKIAGRKVYEEAITKGSAEYAGYTLQESFFESLAKAQPFQEAKKFPGDVLLVHGTADAVIPAEYSFLFQKVFWMRSSGICDKEIIEQADHSFSAKGRLAAVIGKTADWLVLKEKQKQEWYGWTI